MAAAGEVLLLQVKGLAQVSGSPPSPGSPPGWHCAAAARVPDLAGELVRAVVAADRRAGASWAEIGVGLGVRAEAARARFGRTGGAPGAGRSGR
ncbi:hypothetical protein ScoT_62950 [Streptomyces albidoflavus]|uniref:Uncharacterized protein n=1 Tax=Streptomyces albidoflavus TaxID=1886 RepID=A0AA37FF13_9ACTN|nr:hypothetical protein ScoT_62950 [Streptomyces albidoflavus]